jgi:hypothetical protein
VHGACTAPDGGIVLKPGAKPIEQVVETPVGAFNSSPVEVGAFYVDLSGQPASSRGKLALTIAWENPASDYDLVVNDTNDESTDNPEIRSVKASHCKAIDVAVDVYLGVPIDEITLTAKAS